MRNSFACKVCGFLHDSRPWGETGHEPSFEICSCCGVEFGYEDATPLAAQTYRSNWIKQGCPWFEPGRRPPAWNLEDQMRENLE